MMKKLLCSLLIVFCLSASGCNYLARKVGGNVEVKLPANTKFVNASWRENSLWYITRPMRSDEQPETYTFQEDSNFGVMEGTVTFIESRGENK